MRRSEVAGIALIAGLAASCSPAPEREAAVTTPEPTLTTAICNTVSALHGELGGAANDPGRIGDPTVQFFGQGSGDALELFGEVHSASDGTLARLRRQLDAQRSGAIDMSAPPYSDVRAALRITLVANALVQKFMAGGPPAVGLEGVMDPYWVEQAGPADEALGDARKGWQHIQLRYCGVPRVELNETREGNRCASDPSCLQEVLAQPQPVSRPE